jgi:hypothetical protein
MDQDYGARGSLHRLAKPIRLDRLGHKIEVATLEGLALYCEEAFAEGDLGWLVSRLNPGDAQELAGLPQTVLAIVDLLSRDGAHAAMMHLSLPFAKNVSSLISTMTGEHLGALCDILVSWPLHLLRRVWPSLLARMFAFGRDEFTQCYPGMRSLLASVEARTPHPRRRELLLAFDDEVDRLLTVAKRDQTTTHDESQLAPKIHLAMCLHRSVYRDRIDTNSLGALIAELTFICAYSRPITDSHRVLYRALLALETADKKASQGYAYAVQMCSQLLHAIESLSRRDPQANQTLRTHRDYPPLRQALVALQESSVGDGDPASVHVAAGAIKRILYDDDQSASLSTALQSYLGGYQRPVHALLVELEGWAREQDYTKLRVSTTSTAISDIEPTVVFTEGALRDVVHELTTNFDKVRDNWASNQPVAGALDRVPLFVVDIDVQLSIEFVTICLCNPCRPEDYDRIKAGTGIGVAKVRSVLARLGHSYDVGAYNREQGTLTHSLRLQRIHR